MTYYEAEIAVKDLMDTSKSLVDWIYETVNFYVDKSKNTTPVEVEEKQLLLFD